MADPIPPSRKLTRKEAAKYLTARWLTIAPGTLAIHAMRGTGPDYTLTAARGGTALYAPADLDTWARSRLLDPAEARRQRGADKGPPGGALSLATR